MKFLLYSEDSHTCDIVAPILGELIVLCRSLPEAKEYVRTHDVKAFIIELILNDEEDGLALAHYVREIHRYSMTPIIFLALDSRYEREAYKVFRCYDYMSKAISPYWLRDTLVILREKIDPDFTPQGISVRLRTGDFRIQLRNILYMEILNKELVIHTLYNVWNFPYRPIKQFVEQARGELVQCHRSMAVNRRFVERIDYLNRTIHLKDRPEKVLLGPKYMEGIRDLLDGKGEKEK